MSNEQFRHSEITKTIIGIFYDVYNDLGHGFLEIVYERSLALALRQQGLEVFEQVSIPVFFRQTLVGDFTADLLVERSVLLELKSCRSIDESQVGLVLNFGPKPEFKRLVFGNDRKRIEKTTPLMDLV